VNTPTTTIPSFANISLDEPALQPDPRAWQEMAQAHARRPLTELAWRTAEQIDVRPEYHASDLDAVPSSWIHARATTVRSRAVRDDVRRSSHGPCANTPGFSTAEASNAFYRANLAAGQKGLASRSIWQRTAAMTATIRGPRATSAWRASRSTACSTWTDCSRASRSDQISVSMTMNGAVLPRARDVHRRGRETGREARAAVGHDPERHPQRVHGPQHLHLSSHAPSMKIIGDVFAFCAARCRSSTASRSAATTCRKPARRRTSSWPTRSPTGLSTAHRREPAAWTSTTSRRALSFFWAIGSTSSWRSPSSGRRACCGQSSS
jgi:methylmalonyl-CoA mutase